MIDILRKNKVNAGFYIIFSAVALTNLLAIILGKGMSTLTDILMILSVLLILNFSNIRIQYMSKPFFSLCLYFIYTIIYAVFAEYSFLHGPGAIIFTVFNIVIIVALQSVDEWTGKDTFCEFGFYVFGFISIYTCYVLSDGFTNIGAHINSVYGMEGYMIANRLSLSVIPMISIFCCMAYNCKRRFDFLLKIIFTLISIFGVLIVNRRGLIIAIPIVFIVNALTNARPLEISKCTIIKFMGAFILVGVLAVTLYSIPEIREKLLASIESASNALLSLLGYSDVDVSGANRAEIRTKIYGELESFSVLNWLFGKGYMYVYMDFPLFQVLLDMGLIGVIFYSYFQLIIPIKFLFSNVDDPTGKFVKCYAVMSILNLFYAGVPYGYEKFIGTVLLMFYTKKDTVSGDNNLLT